MLGGLLHQVAQRHQPRRHRQGVALEAGEVQQVVDEALQRPGVARDAVDELPALFVGQRRPVLDEQGAEPLDRRHGGTQLVGDRAEEAQLHAIEVAETSHGLLLPEVQLGVAEGGGQEVGDGPERVELRPVE